MRRDCKNTDLFAFSSTMSVQRDYGRYLPHCVFLTLLVASCVAREICDKTKCPGPLKYYRGLGCTPVYKNPGDCCAERFDCSYLENLSKDKCYVNGHKYNVGETLRDEHANSCDVGCTCRSIDGSESAVFICAAVDCAFYPLQDNCFQRNSYNSCCPGAEICLKEGETRATCEVDGKIYKDGESFTPKSNPDLDCYCLPGYKGENIEPFCKAPNHEYCDPLFHRASDIHEKCAPVFYSNQNPQTDCSYTSRCYSENDTIVHNHDAKSVSETDESKMCVYGKVKMHIGDVVNEGDTYGSICVTCTCEVPPFPTCIQQTECDYSRVKPDINRLRLMQIFGGRNDERYLQSVTTCNSSETSDLPRSFSNTASASSVLFFSTKKYGDSGINQNTKIQAAVMAKKIRAMRDNERYGATTNVTRMPLLNTIPTREFAAPRVLDDDISPMYIGATQTNNPDPIPARNLATYNSYNPG